MSEEPEGDEPAESSREADERRSAASVFALLSDGTRVDVLRAVAEARREREPVEGGPAGLSFSELYERVDVDGTSTLSYHLGELVGTFLRKRDGAYALTHAGERIVRFVLARNYERPPEVGPRAVDGTCPFCGATALSASLRERFFTVACRSCERPIAGYPTTPAQVRSFDADELVDGVRLAQVADYERIRRGGCPACGGRLSTTVRDASTIGELVGDVDAFHVVDRCVECLRRYNSPLAYRVAYHPASVAFHWDRGVDVTARAPAALHAHLHEDRWTSERVATDPDEYEVVFRHGDASLRLRLDADATVTHTERVRRRDVDDASS